MSEIWDKIRAGAKIQTYGGSEARYIAESPSGRPVVGFLHLGTDWCFAEIDESGKMQGYVSTIVLIKPMKQLWARRHKRKSDGFVWAELRYAKEGQPPYCDHDVRFIWIDDPVPVGPLIEDADGRSIEVEAGG